MSYGPSLVPEVKLIGGCDYIFLFTDSHQESVVHVRRDNSRENQIGSWEKQDRKDKDRNGKQS